MHVIIRRHLCLSMHRLGSEPGHIDGNVVVHHSTIDAVCWCRAFNKVFVALYLGRKSIAFDSHALLALLANIGDVFRFEYNRLAKRVSRPCRLT